jgi:hypothetical protein
MSLPERSHDLNTLGFVPQWREYGLLPDELLDELLRTFASGEDRNTEHSRYTALLRVLDRECFSDELLNQLQTLLALDPAPVMARAAFLRLLEHSGLTDAQFAALRGHPLLASLSRRIERIALQRELRHGPVTPALLARSVRDGDAVVHTELLALPELPEEIVEALQAQGATRKVRNLAGARRRSSGGR